MKRGRSVLAGLALALVAACGGAAAGEPENDRVRETVRGVVLEVEGGLTSVDSFVLRTDEGEVLEVVPARDGDFRFPLPHLHDHRRTSEPILVELDRSTDPPRAAAVQDADSPAWHTGGEEVPAPAAAPEPAAEGPPAAARPAPTTTATGDAEEAGGEGVDQPPDSAPAAAAPDAAAPPPESEEPEEEPEAAGPVIELEVIDGKLDGGARREAVNLGETVTMRVSGNSRDEIHIHGYDLFVHLEDGAGELVFDASIPGVFEVELEGSHTLLIRLEVS